MSLAGATSAVPVYLYEPNLNDQGRAAYAKGLEACLGNVCKVEHQVGAVERVQRLKNSIYHALYDVLNVAYALETMPKP